MKIQWTNHPYGSWVQCLKWKRNRTQQMYKWERGHLWTGLRYTISGVSWLRPHMDPRVCVCWCFRHTFYLLARCTLVFAQSLSFKLHASCWWWEEESFCGLGVKGETLQLSYKILCARCRLQFLPSQTLWSCGWWDESWTLLILGHR